MKKILIALVLLALLALAAVYLFIPGRIKIETAISVKAAFPAVSRMLIDKNNWKKCWPGESPFNYGKQTYSINEQAYSVYDINIHSGNDTINSRLELVPIKNDITTIGWYAAQVTSSNPFIRFSQYRLANTTEKNMNEILQSMKAFLEKTKNIYGFEINRILVTDSVLISMRRSFEHSPNVKEIDAMIQDLRKYIVQNNAIEKNSPMLNVLKFDSSHYEAMTAIPVDRALPPTTEFAPKYLLKGGNILEAQVQGGPTTIENGLKELENYRSDYRLTSPAIPYQLLVTDRVKEADTAKWITRLYYPVF
ncbi:MAG TPA: hypothetical protein VFU29_07925 [Chitinophagaceae bacterium]|nr:hypothetical protein [Chitinophagaceae bacterium]